MPDTAIIEDAATAPAEHLCLGRVAKFHEDIFCTTITKQNSGHYRHGLRSDARSVSETVPLVRHRGGLSTSALALIDASTV